MTITQGYPPNYGFCYGCCSHSKDLSLTELRLRCNDLESDLVSSMIRGPFSPGARCEALLGKETMRMRRQEIRISVSLPETVTYPG